MSIIDTIEKHFVDGLDATDHRLPEVVCGTCLVIVDEAKKDIFDRKIDHFDYSKLADLRPITRSSPLCDYLVCQIGKCMSKDHFAALGLGFKTDKGRPPLKGCTTAKPSTIHVCSYCLCVKTKGMPHEWST